MNANQRGRHSGPGACVEETGSHKLTWEPVHVTTAEYIDEIEMYVYVHMYVCVCIFSLLYMYVSYTQVASGY